MELGLSLLLSPTFLSPFLGACKVLKINRIQMCLWEWLFSEYCLQNSYDFTLEVTWLQL